MNNAPGNLFRFKILDRDCPRLQIAVIFSKDQKLTKWWDIALGKARGAVLITRVRKTDRDHEIETLIDLGTDQAVEPC